MSDDSAFSDEVVEWYEDKFGIVGESDDEDCRIYSKYMGKRKISIIVFIDTDNDAKVIEKILITKSNNDMDKTSVVAFDEDNVMFKGREPISNVCQ